uniref:Uncharacterized protein n=1 Tax=Rhizophora mucronata TaxID=61149 RepID=A0A2P2N7D2_RHIMU
MQNSLFNYHSFFFFGFS